MGILGDFLIGQPARSIMEGVVMKFPKNAKVVESGVVSSYHPWGFEVELE